MKETNKVASYSLFIILWYIFVLKDPLGIATYFKQPPNTIRNTFFSKLVPAPGYNWNKSAGKYAVKWVAGKKHSKISNIRSTEYVDRWEPDAGYDWIDQEASNKPIRFSFNITEVEWVKGKKHPQIENIRSCEYQRHWETEEGYSWVDRSTSNELQRHENDITEAEWVQGLTNSEYPHIKSSYRKNYWVADAGYRFKNAGSLEVEAYQAPVFNLPTNPYAGMLPPITSYDDLSWSNLDMLFEMDPNIQALRSMGIYGSTPSRQPTTPSSSIKSSSCSEELERCRRESKSIHRKGSFCGSGDDLLTTWLNDCDQEYINCMNR